MAFYSAPLATAAVVRLVLDRVAGGDAGGVWLLLGALAGVEVVRWTMVVAVAVQWHGCWVGWQTVPRVNLLRSLAEEPGPAAGRLPGAPGEAVSRFRDDVEDLALVLDVWLDISGALVSSALAVAVLVAIDPGAALAIAAPVALAALAAWLHGRRGASAIASASDMPFATSCAFASSSVLPFIRASDWARQLAMSRS